MTKGIKVSRLWLLGLFLGRSLSLVVLTALALPGLALSWPIALVAHYYSKKKAKEAKDASNVKVAGRDVLATWKVLVALVLIPLFTILYSIALALAVRYTQPQLSNWQYALIAIGGLFAFPLDGYATIRFTEIGLRLLFSLKPLFRALFPCLFSTTVDVVKLRNGLQREIFQLVQTYGADMIAGGDKQKFNAMRVVRLTDFKNRPSLYGDLIEEDPTATKTPTQQNDIQSVEENDEENDEEIEEKKQYIAPHVENITRDFQPQDFSLVPEILTSSTPSSESSIHPGPTVDGF